MVRFQKGGSGAKLLNRQKYTLGKFSDPGNVLFGEIVCRRTHHSATFAVITCPSLYFPPHRRTSLDFSADTPPGRITQAEGGEQFSSFAEIRGGSRMVRWLTGRRGGVKRKREDPGTERRD